LFLCCHGDENENVSWQNRVRVAPPARGRMEDGGERVEGMEERRWRREEGGWRISCFLSPKCAHGAEREREREREVESRPGCKVNE